MELIVNYEDYELYGADIGELIAKCLSEMVEATKNCEKHDFEWNPSDVELSRWMTFIFAQWIIGKMENKLKVKINVERNPAIKRYIRARSPEIMAYIQSMK